MPLKIITWNINSVRLRTPLLEKLIEQHNPDIICLQETKVEDQKFPFKPFRDLGYEHIEINGQKGYHGVAILSRLAITKSNKRSFCGKEDTRHISVDVETSTGPLRIHNFYVPAGGDEPDPQINEKFDHKLKFLDEMETWLTGSETNMQAVLVGDLNIAPLENDVWSHKQLLKVVSHTPIEIDKLNAVQKAGNWIDAIRQIHSDDEKLFTWWSYRSKDWKASNRGRRLDHIWITPQLDGKISSVEIFSDARSWEKPSDHAPVIAVLDL